MSSYCDLHMLLLEEPGIKLSPGLCTKDVTFDALGVLGDDDLHHFLRLGCPDTGSWHSPYIVRQICHILEMIQDEAQQLIRHHDNPHFGAIDCPTLLSTAHIEFIEKRLTHENARYVRGFFHTLSAFVRVLLAARTAWMMHHTSEWCDEPTTLLEARIHSCLMTLKNAQMRGLPLSTSLINETWLVFDVGESEIRCAMEKCQKAFPR